MKSLVCASDQTFKGFCSLQHHGTIASEENSPQRTSQLIETNHRSRCRSWQMFCAYHGSRCVSGLFLNEQSQ